MQFFSKSSAATKKIAAHYAKKLLSEKHQKKQALVITLSGELGSGKTTFVKGFIGAVAHGRAQSPTFVLMRRFLIRGKSTKFRTIFHIDAYRLKSPKEARILKLNELFLDPTAILLIEWPKRIAAILPQKCVQIIFYHQNRLQRRIMIKMPKTHTQEFPAIL